MSPTLEVIAPMIAASRPTHCRDKESSSRGYAGLPSPVLYRRESVRPPAASSSGDPLPITPGSVDMIASQSAIAPPLQLVPACVSLLVFAGNDYRNQGQPKLRQTDP